MFEPLGFNSSFVFSIVFYTNENAVINTIQFHKNRWPFHPHKLDHLYNLLLNFGFINPSGHFKEMFLIEDPPLENRVLWKKNRTDLIYLGHRLYSEVFKDQFINIIDRVFYIEDKRGHVVTLQKLKKTNRNIRDQICDNELKGNWKTIDLILMKIPLP
jgi:hypothetical protein